MSPGRAHSTTLGSALSARSRASSSSSGRSLASSAWRMALTTHTGWDSTAASAVVLSGASARSTASHASRSRLDTRRRTALTKVAAPSPAAWAARSTVAETAAWLGTRMPSSWWAPSLRTSSTTASMREAGRSEQWAMTAS